jgi:hypothetical protein
LQSRGNADGVKWEGLKNEPYRQSEYTGTSGAQPDPGEFAVTAYRYS